MTGKDLQAWRLRNKLTQVEFAKLLGVPLDTLRSWEQGKRRVPRIMPLALETIARGLKRRRR